MTGWLALLAVWPIVLVVCVLAALAGIAWFALSLESLLRSYGDAGGPPWERGTVHEACDHEPGDAAA